MQHLQSLLCFGQVFPCWAVPGFSDTDEEAEWETAARFSLGTQMRLLPCTTGTMSLCLCLQPRGCKVSESREILGSLWRSPEPKPREPAGDCLGFVCTGNLTAAQAVRTPEREDAEGRERRRERRERTGLTSATAFTSPWQPAALRMGRDPKRGSGALGGAHFPAGAWVILISCSCRGTAMGRAGIHSASSLEPPLSLLMVPGVTFLPLPGIVLLFTAAAASCRNRRGAFGAPSWPVQLAQSSPGSLCCGWGCGSCRSLPGRAGPAPGSSERSQGRGITPAPPALGSQSNSHCLPGCPP